MFAVARALVFSAAGTLVFAVLWRRPSGMTLNYSSWFTLAIIAVAYLSAAWQWWMSRRGRSMPIGAYGLLVLDQALVSGVSFVTGGVSSGATSLFGVTCLVGGLLLGVQGALTGAISGAVFFSLLILITQGEGGLYPSDQLPELYALTAGQAAYYYVFNLLMLLLVALLTSYLSERLQKAGGEVKAAHARADRAERMAELGRLAAGLAHEIRNPLGAISGSVQMLRTGADDEDDRELCDIVLRESGRLNDLVSDMLDLARPRAPRLAPVDVGEVVDDVVELSRQSGRGIEDVSIERQGVQSFYVLADADQLRQLVWNLVRNAIQASAPRALVRVKLECDEEGRLIVEDDGVGIDSEAKLRLFDAFFTTRSQGTGLGLAVVKRIADEHDFEIAVHSQDGEGARFTVHLGPPCKVVPPQTDP